MKKTIMLSAFFLVAMIHPGRCTPLAIGDSTKLLQLEDAMATCYVKFDAKTFDKLVANNFIYSENDQTYSRDEVMNLLSKSTDKIESAVNENMQVYLHGSTALITGWLIIKGTNADGSFERRYRFTDVWMKTKGDWQLIGAHDYIR